MFKASNILGLVSVSCIYCGTSLGYVDENELKRTDEELIYGTICKKCKNIYIRLSSEYCEQSRSNSKVYILIRYSILR